MKESLYETILAYTAGILDGEGSIMLPRLHKKITYLRVAISNTDFNLIKFLLNNFGGSFVEYHHKNPNWKRQYCWVVASKQALNFLSSIRPYLILKSQQADIAIEFQLRKRSRGQYQTKEEKLLDATDVGMMHKLNKRGKIVTI